MKYWFRRILCDFKKGGQTTFSTTKVLWRSEQEKKLLQQQLNIFLLSVQFGANFIFFCLKHGSRGTDDKDYDGERVCESVQGAFHEIDNFVC